MTANRARAPLSPVAGIDLLAKILAELEAMRAAQRSAFALLNRKLDAIGRRDGRDVGRLADFLAAAYGFSGSAAWTASELIADARRAGRRDVLGAFDAIVGERGDPAKRLGRWLERHDGAALDGLHLTRIKREGGAWVYSIGVCED